MKKIFLTLVFFLFSGSVFAGDPVMYQDPFIYFKADRNPTATETVMTSQIDNSWLFDWENTTTKDKFGFKGGSDGSYVWDLYITDKNINQFLPMAIISKFYLGTTQKTNAKFIAKNATVAGGAGAAIFYLTDNGLAGGNAICTNVYDDTISFEINNSANSYRWSWTISGDKKTLTATVNQSTAVTLLGIQVLGGLAAATNGTVVRLNVLCD